MKSPNLYLFIFFIFLQVFIRAPAAEAAMGRRARGRQGSGALQHPLLLAEAWGRTTPGPTVAADLGGSGSVSGAGGASRAAQRGGGAAAPAGKGKVLPGSWTRRGAAGRLAQPCGTGGEGE